MPDPALKTSVNSTGHGRNLAVLLIVAAVVRGLVLLALPANAVSADLSGAKTIAGALSVGFNPYSHGTLYNYSPFWMEFIYCVTRVAERFDWDFYDCYRIALIVADLGVLTATFALIRSLNPQARYMRLLLLGYCLNPLLILVSVQHANIDAIAMLWVMLFAGALVRFNRDGNSMNWLLAAGFLGLGIFVKTFPLILAPMLALGARSLDRRTIALGAAMLVGPFAISLAPMFVLNAAAITQHVLGYRSFGASFGILGFLTLADADLTTIHRYGQFWTPLFALLLAAIALVLSRAKKFPDSKIVLLATLIFLFVLTTGTGYGWQYWFWATPLILVCYRQYPGSMRTAIWVWGIVIALTALFEYAVVPGLGQSWHWNHSTAQLDAYSNQWNQSDMAGARVQFPATLATFAVLFCGMAHLLRRSDALATPSVSGDNAVAEKE